MEIKAMNMDQIIARKSEIKEALSNDDLTMEAIDSFETEIKALNERKNSIEDAVEKRKALEKRIINSTDLNVLETKSKGDGEKMDQVFNLESKEFRSAYFKTLAGEALTDIEARAYTHTTANYGGALPVETVADIWSNIEEEHPILGDITTYRTGTVLEITVHTGITAGDAKTVAENAANVDEQNAFVKVTLSGKDFSKHVEVSYALGRMTAGALESYLVKEIGQRLGVALANDVATQIKTDTAAANKVETETAGAVGWKDLNAVFALLKGAGQKVVYVNGATLYNHITAMVDTTKRPIFQPNAQDGAQGRLLGAEVKIEDALADGEILVGNPKKVVGNFIQDIMIEQDKDIKRHVDIYAGYARFQCKLTNDKSFAVLTVKTGA